MGRAREREPLTMEQRELCSRHLRLVERLAVKYGDTRVPPEDRLQDAYMGLLDAARKFDPENGVKFETYATHCVLGRMRSAAREVGYHLVPPKKTKSQPRPKLPAVIPVGTTKSMYEDDGDRVAFDSVIFATQADASLDERDEIDVALRSLPDLHRYVVVRYCVCDKPLRAIGEEVERSESRMSQILAESLSQLRGCRALADHRREAASCSF